MAGDVREEVPGLRRGAEAPAAPRVRSPRTTSRADACPPLTSLASSALPRRFAGYHSRRASETGSRSAQRPRSSSATSRLRAVRSLEVLGEVGGQIAGRLAARIASLGLASRERRDTARGRDSRVQRGGPPRPARSRATPRQYARIAVTERTSLRRSCTVSGPSGRGGGEGAASSPQPATHTIASAATSTFARATIASIPQPQT